MPNKTNQAYFGTAGTLVIDGDNHFGVTAFSLTPTTPEAQIPDITGDVQSFNGVPTWRCGINWNQDHITDGSLSRQSPEWAGTVVPATYTPEDGGEGRAVNIRWANVPFGGDTTQHVVQADFPVVGQPTIVAPA